MTNHTTTGPGERSRQESDSMGTLSIPYDAMWGAQTQRAVENFVVSPFRIPLLFMRALGQIKRHAARANAHLGLIPAGLAEKIATAAAEVQRDRWVKHFPVDIFQTGSGTSWNMNVNELVANRANQLLGQPLGSRSPVHPNDHVNRGQSSNDVIPTALHIANRCAVAEMVPAIERLRDALYERAAAFSHTIKLGRTHLQDAVPMTLGQEFSGFGAHIKHAVRSIQQTFPALEELPLGGTAVGTGLNTHPQFAQMVVEAIAKESGFSFRVAENRFALIAGRDAQVALMGALNGLAVALMKIANDLRLLASGPRAGLGEIILPALQPGSSIMPGKINPVIPEMVIQVAAYIMGKYQSVVIAAQHAPLELNMMHPLMAHETLTAIEVVRNACRLLAERCISGIEADEQRCEQWIEQSLALVTPLALRIGYDRAAELAHRAYRERRTIREVAREARLLPDDELNALLDPRQMVTTDNS